ncbi:unnamed protein product [Rotaria sp. Silwood1]|nr:unnamed protein product [Rotaria sp. Silwood1]
MAQINSTSNVVNSNDNTNPSTKPSDTLRPHYYTTFQNYCCGPKSNSSTSTPPKDVLPIPQIFKEEAAELVEYINHALIEQLTDVVKYTSVIPHTFLEKNDNYDIQRYLIDRIMFRTMNDAHVINWIPSLKMLYPIRTSGNGNCLLHAVLIAMVGIHDLDLYFRDRLVQFMTENKDVLKNYWKKERLKSDKAYGISSEDSKLDEEWNEVCDLVRYENSKDGQIATQLEFLEAIHIFSISNMLHRPIIVLSEDVIRNKNGEAISVNDLFGIYLPILSTPDECIIEPIVLAYDRSHFCPLQTTNANVGKALDNRLPLYLSIEHAYNNISLPIRFLGDDDNIEYSNNLLRDYLRIQKVEYSFDEKSSPLSILCVTLGVQKPKAIAEERERERQRELDDYVNRHISYDTRGRSIIKQDPTLSSSSTPMSARSNTTLNESQLRNQNNNYDDQIYSYNGTYTNQPYIPSNGAVYIKNSSNQPQQSPRVFEHRKVAQTDRDINYPDTEQSKQLNLKNDLNNISNLNNNDKQRNPVSFKTGEDEYKFNREQRQPKVIEIPVQYATPRVSSNDSTLFISEEPRDSLDKCLTCHRPFRDVKSIRICSDCDSELQRRTPHYDVRDRSYIRPRSTNVYLTGDNTRYVPASSPVPKTKIRRSVECPHLSPLRTTNILINARWAQNGITVAGGNGGGNELNQLLGSEGLYIANDQTAYIADYNNHRIMEWKYGATNGKVIAGGNGQGSRADQMSSPSDVIIDKASDSLIICDKTNRRVVRWPRQGGLSGETIISNIDCWGVTMDHDGSLYVCDHHKCEVRRWRIGETHGTVVAGGNGRGEHLDQLNSPLYVFVDYYRTVYVSDSENHRVMKWLEGAREGIVVAGGRGRGNDLTQLSDARGVIVDQWDTVYVADCDNHRIMCWPKGATHGNILVCGNGEGEQANQVIIPAGLSFDRYGNLYVVDWGNHRVQRFDIDPNS